jgi:hypothetical protein
MPISLLVGRTMSRLERRLLGLILRFNRLSLGAPQRRKCRVDWRTEAHLTSCFRSVSVIRHDRGGLSEMDMIL